MATWTWPCSINPMEMPMRTLQRMPMVMLAASALLLAGCSTSPPKAPLPDERTRSPANDPARLEMLDAAAKIQQATAQLLAVARAGAAQGLADAALRPTALSSRALSSTSTSGGNVIYTYRFRSGGTALDLPPAAAGALIEAARQAQLVVLRGRTDAVRDDAANAAIARRRAEAAQALLFKGGVPIERIRVTWQASGDTVADNGTAAGRAANRRVEIELYPLQPEQARQFLPAAVLAVK
jgi:outer membrane protein OmpA-like peptidoglycan-associated protein